MNHEVTRAMTVAVAKTSPAVAAVFWMQDMIVTVCTVGYIALQAAYLIWRWRNDWCRKRQPPAGTPD